MTLRVRRPDRGIRTRLGRLFEGEERQQLVVTALFIAAIAAVLLILIGAIGLAWYNDNLRPLARVGSVEIGPQLLRDRLSVEQWRIMRDEGRVDTAQIDGEIDAETALARKSALDQRAQALSTTGLDDLIDTIYQSQLATEEGLTVSDADVDQRLQTELAGVERRHVWVIVIEPQAADEDAGPTVIERRAALARAEAAQAQLRGGTDWSEVARQFSTDPSAPGGGDLGLLTRAAIDDEDFTTELFKIDQGATTGITRGADGFYRIGRVTEIVTAGEEPGLRTGLFEDVSEQSVRQLLRFEVGAERLRDKIVSAALAATPEQVRIAVIYIEGLFSGDPEDAEGEVDYSEIVFAPNDDLIDAPDLAADDPAWAVAKTQADTILAELQAIIDPDARQARFEDIATDTSDSTSADDGGAVGFATRSIPPTAVADALFDATHLPNDLIGPVRGDAAWYVLLFHERRASPEQRVQAVKDALATPGANFNAVASELSEGPEKEDGGEVGWLTRDQLTQELVDRIFVLESGEVSEPFELDEGHYFVKVEAKAVRPLDADQVPNIRVAAFQNWYSLRLQAAETNGTIVRNDGGADEGNLEPGGDQDPP